MIKLILDYFLLIIAIVIFILPIIAISIILLFSPTKKIIHWSKFYSCEGVEINGRRGWERVLKDYKPSAITLVKEI